MDDKGQGIYMIVNTHNYKVYVGSAVRFRRRMNDHFRRLRGDFHHCQYLQRSYNKHGKDAFVFVVIEHVPYAGNKADNEFLLKTREKYWIGEMDSTYKKHGYNLSDDPFRPMFSEHTRQKQSEARKRFYANGGKSWNEGLKMSEEFREGCRQRTLGQKHSETHRINVSNSLNAHYATHESKNKGITKTFTEQHKKHLSEAGKGKVITDEWRRNLSISHSGYVMPEEQKTKIGEASRRSWAKRKAAALLDKDK